MKGGEYYTDTTACADAKRGTSIGMIGIIRLVVMRGLIQMHIVSA